MRRPGAFFDTNGLALTLSLPPIHPKTRLSIPLHLPTLPRRILYGKAPAHRGWGYCVSTERRGRLGGTFVQGIHSTSSSINPLLFFSRPRRRRRRRRHRVTAVIDSPPPSSHRAILYGGKHQTTREGLWRSLRPRGKRFADQMMCNCVRLHDGLTREHRTRVDKQHARSRPARSATPRP